MPSAIDFTKPVTGQPASKADLRANWKAARGEINHGGFFKATGTEAVERQTQEKLRDVVSVTDFGAVGDGTSNDTEAIKAALTTADVVVFPVGKYLIDPIDVPSGKILFGYGASLKLAPQTGLYMSALRLTNVTDVNILGLTIDGDYPSQNPPTSDEDGGVHCIRLCGAKRILLRDCVGKNAYTDGLILIDDRYALGNNRGDRCEDVVVDHCRFENNRRVGLGLMNVKRAQFLWCDFINSRGTSPEGGVDLEPDLNDQDLEDILFLGCTITGCHGPGFSIHMKGGRLQGVVVRDTKIVNNLLDGISGMSLNVGGSGLARKSGSHIRDLTFDNVTWDGIFKIGDFADDQAYYENVVVQNSQAIDATARHTFVGGIMRVYRVRTVDGDYNGISLRLLNNSFLSDPKGSQCLDLRKVSGIIIDGNVFRPKNNDAISFTKHPIKNIRIVRNEIDGARNASGRNSNGINIAERTFVENIWIVENFVHGCGGKGLWLQGGSKVFIDDNILQDNSGVGIQIDSAAVDVRLGLNISGREAGNGAADILNTTSLAKVQTELRLPVVIEMTTARTLTAADAGKYIRCTNDLLTTITVSTNIFAPGDVVTIAQQGRGTITLAGSATGVGAITWKQYKAICLVFTSTSSYDILG
jgi:hypothetical protein